MWLPALLRYRRFMIKRLKPRARFPYKIAIFTIKIECSKFRCDWRVKWHLRFGEILGAIFQNFQAT